ncbi:MAG: hydantoinase B/oxoprolinase family protein [Alphaproteobacteria bacterium]|nr:hydantoinase B/oxoprolinase family protein [Alphaproteobacteria bacterium]
MASAAARASTGAAKNAGNARGDGFDPVQLAIMANRVQAITREMTNTVVLTARSSVIGMARDFSCAILTGDGDLLDAAEGLPVHIFGINLQGKAMLNLHPDLKEGDAFLHNDPYLGNSHPADHATLVPVFVDGEHLFTAAVKAHQADCGNAIPTTYYAAAQDVYMEGSLNFPCVKVQSGYKDNDDIIRMCRKRIRIPDQWYGDYLAGIGAARIGERRLKEFCAKYGVAEVKRFVKAWFDYSERRAENAIRKLPSAKLVHHGKLDPLPPFLPEGVPLKVAVDIDAAAGRITVDLRDNPDCVDSGVNQSEATAIANAITGVFNCLEWDVPHNSGSFRRVSVLLRENCVAGIPRFPHSCSTATTLLADVIVNVTQSAFGQLGEGYGLSEGNYCNSAGASVVSGTDWRRGGAAYVNQIFLMGGGGPASPRSDGMIYLLVPPGAGLLYRDSVEVDEQRFPVLIRAMELVQDSAGAGRFRGGPATRCVYGPRRDDMLVITISNGQENPPRGVQGGADAESGANHKLHTDGRAERLPGLVICPLKAGEWIMGLDNGGGGYGDPLEREPPRVLNDVLEGYESAARARDVYGVVFEGEIDDDSLAINLAATASRRQELRAARRQG